MDCQDCESPVDGSRCSQCGAAVLVREYTVLRVIAQTPHGRVYVARDPSRRLIALKELTFSLAPGARQIERFQQEASTLQSLSHPAIPRFVDAFTDGDGPHRRFYLAQEYVAGRSLLELLQRQPLPEIEVEEIARELLEVLIYLHSRDQKVIHRDIKPANLITRTDGRLVLVDFGAARFLEEDGARKATFIGTLGYAPPEQLTGTVDESTDLYAVGATLIHLLSGKSPKEMFTPDMELKFIGSVNAPGLAPFLARLVARLPRRRFRSAREALHALNALVKAPVRVRSWRRRVPVLVGTAVLVAAGSFLLLHGRARPSATTTLLPMAEKPPPR
jgi:serine/threonine protein kinase